MERAFFGNESSEEARTRHIVAIFLKGLWTLLTTAAIVGVLLPLTIFLGWWRFLLSCLLGLLTGFSISVGLLSSSQSRALIALLLGVLTLPGFAIFLSLMFVSSVQAFEASSAVLTPFFIYALVTFIGVLVIIKIWKNMPVMEQEEAPGQ